MQEVDNVLRIFKEARVAIKKDDAVALKELSNQTINTASRTNDADNIATAVVIYALGKVIERNEYRKNKSWDKFLRNVSISIDAIISGLEEGNEEKVRMNLSKITSSIKGLSGDLKKHIEDVFLKAKINKASKIYEHGISMERTASLLGITMYELAGYTGQKLDGFEVSKALPIKTRVKIAEEMFE